MKRTAVNPWEWSLQYAFNQAEVIEDVTRTVIGAGQTSIDRDGQLQHAGDLAGRLRLSLDNLEGVLKAAGMDLSNVIRLTIYTTDVDRAHPGLGRAHRALAEGRRAAAADPPWRRQARLPGAHGGARGDRGRIEGSSARSGAHDALIGSELFDRVREVDQTPIGKTPRRPRSNWR